jgi:hypothetical protein
MHQDPTVRFDFPEFVPLSKSQPLENPRRLTRRIFPQTDTHWNFGGSRLEDRKFPKIRKGRIQNRTKVGSGGFFGTRTKLERKIRAPETIPDLRTGTKTENQFFWPLG